jgi:hypothetical protein
MMKIYMLLMLIGVFVGFSFPPMRHEMQQGSSFPPDSLPS